MWDVQETIDQQKNRCMYFGFRDNHRGYEREKNLFKNGRVKLIVHRMWSFHAKLKQVPISSFVKWHQFDEMVLLVQKCVTISFLVETITKNLFIANEFVKPFQNEWTTTLHIILSKDGFDFIAQILAKKRILLFCRFIERRKKKKANKEP